MGFDAVLYFFLVVLPLLFSAPSAPPANSLGLGPAFMGRLPAPYAPEVVPARCHAATASRDAAPSGSAIPAPCRRGATA